MTARTYLRAVWTVVRKDLLVEARSKRVLATALVFALLVVVAFAFAFATAVSNLAVLGRGALWIAFVFAGTVSVTQAVTAEYRDSAIDGLLLAPVDRTAIYFGKVASNAVFVATLSLSTLSATVVFLNYRPPVAMLAALAGVVGVAAIGFSAVGVVLSLLAARANLRESLVPVLLVPLVVPILLAGVELTRLLGVGGALGSWLRLLVAYTGILLLAGMVVFESVVAD